MDIANCVLSFFFFFSPSLFVFFFRTFTLAFAFPHFVKELWCLLLHSRCFCKLSSRLKWHPGFEGGDSLSIYLISSNCILDIPTFFSSLFL